MHAYLTGILRNLETFQDEFRSLLSKHGVGFDERYVWD
jgi:hypothetical protein